MKVAETVRERRNGLIAEQVVETVADFIAIQRTRNIEPNGTRYAPIMSNGLHEHQMQDVAVAGLARTQLERLHAQPSDTVARLFRSAGILPAAKK